MNWHSRYYVDWLIGSEMCLTLQAQTKTSPGSKEAEKYTDGKQLVEQSSKEKFWPSSIASRHVSSMLRSPHPVFCFNWTHCTQAGSTVFNVIPASFKFLSADHSYWITSTLQMLLADEHSPTCFHVYAAFCEDNSVWVALWNIMVTGSKAYLCGDPSAAA